MNPKLKEALDYQIEVAKWVKAMAKWAAKNAGVTAQGDGGPGSNPPPPPPPPPGIEP